MFDDFVHISLERKIEEKYEALTASDSNEQESIFTVLNSNDEKTDQDRLLRTLYEIVSFMRYERFELV